MGLLCHVSAVRLDLSAESFAGCVFPLWLVRWVVGRLVGGSKLWVAWLPYGCGLGRCLGIGMPDVGGCAETRSSGPDTLGIVAPPGSAIILVFGLCLVW